MKSADQDGPSEYECHTCPAITRAIRGCTRWPPPAVIRLIEVAPGIGKRVSEMGPPTKGAKAKAMKELLMGTTWGSVEARNLGAAILDGVNMAQSLQDGTTCPVNDISATSYRIIDHYQSRQQFAPEGVLLPPRDDYMACSSRMVHGFSVIWNESRRLNRLDKATREADKP